MLKRLSLRGSAMSTISNAALLLLIFPVIQFCLATEDAHQMESSQPAKTDKRSPQFYRFGLGKKSTSEDAVEYVPLEDSAGDDTKRGGETRFQFGLGKRGDFEKYSFGLGKRGGVNRFAFGIGKRDPSRYAFGIGKRDPKGRFAFGLGKREIDNDIEDYIKRRFSFGLGKRSDPTLEDYGMERRKRSPPNYLSQSDMFVNDGLSQ